MKRSNNEPGTFRQSVSTALFPVLRVFWHGIRGGGEYLLQTPENAISETLNFKMLLDATALKNLCLGASSKAAYYS